MRSIERHLLAWVLGALTLGAVVLMAAVYLVTLEEMDEVFDENLKQVALAVASHHPIDGALPAPGLPALPRAYEQQGDFDFVTQTGTRDGVRSFSSNPSVALPLLARNGLTEMHVRESGENWHIYSIVQGERIVQAAQRASSRRELAAEAASEMSVPLVVLIVLMGVLLVYALRRGLRPLDVAAQGVAARSAASLAPISRSDLPREIHPLILAINGLMQRLAVAFTTQRQFVADAAHELRTPVTALRLQVQLLERAADEPTRRHAIAELKTGIDRSQHLIEQLLQLSRVEPDTPRERFERIDLGELVRGVVGSLAIKADDRGIDLGAETQVGIEVPGNRSQLTILLNNLVENALRHSPSGGTVDVKATRIDGCAALQVIDQGPGIAEAERTRVFDRFYRGENSAGEADGLGSGLGLAIVKAIADQHAATTTLHTGPGGAGLEARVVFAAAPAH